MSVLDQGEFRFFIITEHGIQFQADTPESEWLIVMEELCDMYEGGVKVAERALMLTADALNWGENLYGERYAQAIDNTRQALGLSPKTLANAKWVYGKIPAERRRSGLTLGHYSVLAALPAEEQETLMSAAINEHMTVSTLKEHVSEIHPKTRRGKTRKAKEKPVEETSATILQKLIDASNWFSEHEPIEKMKGPLSKLHLAFRRKWGGKKR